MQTKPLFLGGATLLGYSQSINYFGSNIGFKKTTTISVQCVSDSVIGGSSPTAGFSLVDGVKDFGDLFINGQGFGAAKLTSFSTVDSVTVALTFEICEKYENLSELSGAYYGDYKSAEMNGCELDSFSDTLTLGRGENSTSYNRTISITANNSQNLTDTTAVIGNFARLFMGFTTFSFPDLSGFDSEINDLTGSNIKKNITETVDAIGLKFSFQESMTAGNVKGNYSVVSSSTYTKNEQGVSTASESGTIQGLTSNRFGAAQAGHAAEIAGAGDRLKALFEKYSGDGDEEEGCVELNENEDGSVLLITDGRTENTFEGIISYRVSANNDPKSATKDKDGKDTGGIKHTYVTTVSKSDGGDCAYSTATEQGTIVGGGNETYNFGGGGGQRNLGLGLYPMYEAAQTFYAGEIPNIDSRISALIEGASPKPISRSERHSPPKGSISYTRVYSNKPEHAENDGIAKSITHTTSTKQGVPIQNMFICLTPGSDQSISQRAGGNSLTEVTNSVRIVGKRADPSGSPSESITSFGDLGIEKLEEGATEWLSSLRYTYAVANNVSFSMSVTYLGGDSTCP